MSGQNHKSWAVRFQVGSLLWNVIYFYLRIKTVHLFIIWPCPSKTMNILLHFMPMDPLKCYISEACMKLTFSRVDCCSIKMDIFRKALAVNVKLLDGWLIRILYEFSITWFVALLNVFSPFFVSPIIIIPLIWFPSLARPINFWWHLSEWNKWNDWFPSFVQRVRHYMTYVGSLPYLEPIIWWVGRQPTSADQSAKKPRHQGTRLALPSHLAEVCRLSRIA